MIGMKVGLVIIIKCILMNKTVKPKIGRYPGVCILLPWVILFTGPSVTPEVSILFLMLDLGLYWSY